MYIIYEADSKKIVCWSESGQDALYPSPTEGQTDAVMDCTVAEFEKACRESSGEWQEEGVGPNYLHDTVDQATNSTKTTGKGVKIGHKAVECEHPGNVKMPTPIADKITAMRKGKGQRLDTPVTLDELREAGI